MIALIGLIVLTPVVLAGAVYHYVGYLPGGRYDHD